MLSSDKTNISVMTGNRVAYPILLSLANLHMDVRMKASHHGFLLIGLIPCARFLTDNRKHRSMLLNRLVHHCLDIICAPLKLAARFGREMSDPCGQKRFCFTPLVSYIADTPEAALLACVGGKTSHVTMATYKQFGDGSQNEPRTRSTTLAQLAVIASQADPWDLSAYGDAASKFRLNGVHLPVWRDWFCGLTSSLMADPYRFLTPEILHHWHKQFWDHDAKWFIRALANGELDFRLSVLPDHVGYRRFKEGISALKQVTGREHRDLECVIVAAAAEGASDGFVLALRSLMDFRYIGQAEVIDGNMINDMTIALDTFHAWKSAVLDAGARVGKGKKRMDHFQIPKLEMMQSVVPSISWAGAPIQWSADVTEHAHITEVKIPARSGNNKQYSSQICRFLDRAEKRRNFDLATSIHECSISLFPGDEGFESDDENAEEPISSSLLTAIHPNESFSPARQPPNFFERAELLRSDPPPSVPRPFRTFSIGSAAFHLNRRPDINSMSIDQVVQRFGLPDLRPALVDYLYRLSQSSSNGKPVLGGRRATHGANYLPFENLQVWFSVKVQRKGDSYAGKVGKAEKLMVSPPVIDETGEPSKFGRYDTALFCNGDPRLSEAPGPDFLGAHLFPWLPQAKNLLKPFLQVSVLDSFGCYSGHSVKSSHLRCHHTWCMPNDLILCRTPGLQEMDAGILLQGCTSSNVHLEVTALVLATLFL